MKRHALTLTIVLLSSALALLAAEAVAQIYVYNIAQKGKLLQPDFRVGWRPLPNLSLLRLNANGNEWSIATDEHGVRGHSDWQPNAQTRILVVGDSFAFGEGVNIESRFDSIIEREIPSVSIVNLGVMGYGTDQQMIAARPYVQSLRKNDILMVLTYQNDFFDILRANFSGRSKPWFELSDGDVLTENSPNISWVEILRDKSYVFARLAVFIEQRREFTDADIDRSAKLYEGILRNETRQVVTNGIKVLVAFHGMDSVAGDMSRRKLQASIDNVCNFGGYSCLSLDGYLNDYGREKTLLGDGHWNEVGHAVVAAAIGKHLLNSMEPN